MTGTIKVIPAEGACVRQPERLMEPVPATGGLVPDTAYYRRFLLTGDLLEAAPELPAAAAPDAAPPRRRFAPRPSTTEQE
ncbi:DUF2635 domain-containing protein [Bosea sp. TWI1241]|uniref:DUF2635 domain-containing protein n=1 Tax=Bosea sp. TWI1241 TaxID=3148904 RepID=UPI0032096FEE